VAPERPLPEARRRPGTCLNGKVIAGLAVLALGLFVVAPKLVPRVAPLLLVAACPASMLVMMWGMRGNQGRSGECSRPSESAGAARSAQSPEEELAALRSQVSRMTAQQELLQARLAAFEAPAGGHGREGRGEESAAAPRTGDAASR
jgi:hypothetical protein